MFKYRWGQILLIIGLIIIGLIIALMFGYRQYLKTDKVYPIKQSVNIGDIQVVIDEIRLHPRFLLGAPFNRELIAMGRVIDNSGDSKFTYELHEVITVYFKDSRPEKGMGFSQNQPQYLSFWTNKNYDGNKSLQLIVQNKINNTKIPLNIDLDNFRHDHETKEG